MEFQSKPKILISIVDTKITIFLWLSNENPRTIASKKKEYEQFDEIDKEVLLERFAVLLGVMGFSGIALPVLMVAVTVYIIRIGLKPFADKYCSQ